MARMSPLSALVYGVAIVVWFAALFLYMRRPEFRAAAASDPLHHMKRRMVGGLSFLVAIGAAFLLLRLFHIS